MKPFSLTRSDRSYTIEIDKEYVDEASLIRIFNQIETEHLIKKANFDQSELEKLDEHVKSEWWKKNKKRLTGED